MAKRLTEFCTYRKLMICDCLHLYTWATYKRGDIPDIEEYKYVNKLITDKYPRAELRRIQRVPIPSWEVADSFTRVRWEFEWIVYNYKKDNEVNR